MATSRVDENLTYRIALSRGNPSEWKLRRKSQSGQFSTSSSSIHLSPKIIISNFPEARRRDRILRIGLLRALRSIAHTPSFICFGFGCLSLLGTGEFGIDSPSRGVRIELSEDLETADGVPSLAARTPSVCMDMTVCLYA